MTRVTRPIVAPWNSVILFPDTVSGLHKIAYHRVSHTVIHLFVTNTLLLLKINLSLCKLNALS